jgi:hypothetical protein
MIRFSIAKRAAIIAALFLSSELFAAPPTVKTPAKTETYLDVVDKAYNLSIQKERSQATLLLVNAVKKEAKKNPKAIKDLLKALEQIGSVFYSDKTQQLYELGISLRLSDPGLAMQKINDALKLEPDNLSVSLAQMRLQIASGDCGPAVNGAKKAKELNPFSEEIDLVISQAAVCSGQFETYQQLKNLIDDKKSPLARHWMVVELEYLFKNGQFQRGIELALGGQKNEPQFPEAYYWEWRLEIEAKGKAEPPATRYVNLCKTLSSRALRDYLAEPFLCRRTQEVENFLKKNSNSGL